MQNSEWKMRVLSLTKVVKSLLLFAVVVILLLVYLKEQQIFNLKQLHQQHTRRHYDIEKVATLPLPSVVAHWTETDEKSVTNLSTETNVYKKGRLKSDAEHNKLHYVRQIMLRQIDHSDNN